MANRSARSAASLRADVRRSRRRLDENGVGRPAQGVERVDDAVDVDRAPFAGGRNVRRNRRVEQVGIDELTRCLHAGGGDQG